jgi:hypothetical protein
MVDVRLAYCHLPQSGDAVMAGGSQRPLGLNATPNIAPVCPVPLRVGVDNAAPACSAALSALEGGGLLGITPPCSNSQS